MKIKTMSKDKHIAVTPDTHHQAKVNATVKGKPLKVYIAELVEKDTNETTPTATKKGK